MNTNYNEKPQIQVSFDGNFDNVPNAVNEKNKQYILYTNNRAKYQDKIDRFVEVLDRNSLSLLLVVDLNAADDSGDNNGYPTSVEEGYDVFVDCEHLVQRYCGLDKEAFEALTLEEKKELAHKEFYTSGIEKTFIHILLCDFSGVEAVELINQIQDVYSNHQRILNLMEDSLEIVGDIGNTDVSENYIAVTPMKVIVATNVGATFADRINIDFSMRKNYIKEYIIPELNSGKSEKELESYLYNKEVDIMFFPDLIDAFRLEGDFEQILKDIGYASYNYTITKIGENDEGLDANQYTLKAKSIVDFEGKKDIGYNVLVEKYGELIEFTDFKVSGGVGNGAIYESIVSFKSIRSAAFLTQSEELYRFYEACFKQDIQQLSIINYVSDDTLKIALSRLVLTDTPAPMALGTLNSMARMRILSDNNTTSLFQKVSNKFQATEEAIYQNVIPEALSTFPSINEGKENLTIGFFGFERNPDENTVYAAVLSRLNKYIDDNSLTHKVITVDSSVDDETILDSLNKGIYHIIILGSSVGVNARFPELIAKAGKRVLLFDLSNKTFVRFNFEPKA